MFSIMNLTDNMINIKNGYMLLIYIFHDNHLNLRDILVFVMGILHTSRNDNINCRMC